MYEGLLLTCCTYAVVLKLLRPARNVCMKLCCLLAARMVSALKLLRPARKCVHEALLLTCCTYAVCTEAAAFCTAWDMRWLRVHPLTPRILCCLLTARVLQ